MRFCETQDVRDLLVAITERLAQHEDGALCWCQLLEEHEERQGNRVALFGRLQRAQGSVGGEHRLR